MKKNTKRDRQTQDKKVLELKLMKLRNLTPEQLALAAGGACTIGSCNATCSAGTSAI